MTAHFGDVAFAASRLAGAERAVRRKGAAPAPEPPPLRDLPLFASVDETTLHRLSAEAKIEVFADGDVLFRQGDSVVSVYVLLSGYVKLLRVSSSGEETLIGVSSDGSCLCDAPVRGDETYSLSAEAVGAATALKLPAGRFARQLRESPALSAAMLGEARDTIAALIGEIEALKAHSADERLARFLLALCPPGVDHCRFRLPYDKRLIAARLGVKQETLSRAFAKLRGIGVRTETREVSVESVARLAGQCEERGRGAALPSERG